MKCPHCGNELGRLAEIINAIPTGEKNAILFRTVARKVYGTDPRSKNRLSTSINSIKKTNEAWDIKFKDAILPGKKIGRKLQVIWKEKKDAVHISK